MEGKVCQPQPKIKKSEAFASLFFCAEEEIRTPTTFRSLPPQSSASTNFATSASDLFGWADAKIMFYCLIRHLYNRSFAEYNTERGALPNLRLFDEKLPIMVLLNDPFGEA